MLRINIITDITQKKGVRHTTGVRGAVALALRFRMVLRGTILNYVIFIDLLL